MPGSIQVRQGINFLTYTSDLTAAMSTYNNSLCFIESPTQEGKLFPDDSTDPIGYSYNPVEPLFSSIKNFENTKSYYVDARQAFTLNLPGLSSKQYQWYRVLPPKTVTPAGGQPYPASYKYTIGFDRSIKRTPISACITPVENRKFMFISARFPNNQNVTVSYIGFNDEPGGPVDHLAHH